MFIPSLCMGISVTFAIFALVESFISLDSSQTEKTVKNWRICITIAISAFLVAVTAVGMHYEIISF